MADQEHPRYHGIERSTILSTSPPVRDWLELDASSALTTTVDGGLGVSTATAIRSGSTARSRSRSPHPAAALAEGRRREQETEHRQSHQLDTRDTSLDLQSFLSGSNNGSNTDLSTPSDHGKTTGENSALPTGLRARMLVQWEEKKGLVMVMGAMVFGALMGAVARLMETGPNPMHTFQILFARMSITAALSMAYMWWRKVPDAPLGPRGVRRLLVARGMGGFFGVFGLYYSVQYIPLGEATVITFLSPMVANWACSVLLKETFTRREQLAGVISLVGVVFIARPTSFLSSGPDPAADSPTGAFNGTAAADSPVSEIPEATPAQRMLAIFMSLLGVCGAACAYTTIRWIGKRAHPLISVNYFSVWCTFVSLAALAAVPGVDFRLPAGAREWLLLLSLGTFGMGLQFLLTAGLARQKGSAATNMTYTQMLFVLAIDYALWGTVLTWSSWAGCALILGSQVWGAMARGEALKQSDDGGGSGGGERRVRRGGEPTAPGRRSDEEAGLVDGIDLAEDGEEGRLDGTHMEMTEMTQRK